MAASDSLRSQGYPTSQKVADCIDAAMLLLQSGVPFWGGVTGGTANAQTLSLTPAPTAYVDGLTIRFRAGNSVTGAATLDVNGLGAITIKKNSTLADLVAGDLDANIVAEVIYQGGVFRLMPI